MEQPLKFWTMRSCIQQLLSCDYESQGGPLKLNDAFVWLQAASKGGPEFMPGQGVFYKVTAEAAGQTLEQWVHFYITGCKMDSDMEKRYWTYSLSYDPPRPYHYGETHYINVRGRDLRTDNPSQPDDKE